MHRCKNGHHFFCHIRGNSQERGGMFDVFSQRPGQGPDDALSPAAADTGLARCCSSARVAVLMGTFNGERFLAEQLDSVAAQTHFCWEVWASDDGSKDNTHTILEAYRSKWGSDRLSVLEGPARGLAANFLSLACKAGIQADYYAYSDQDDIWEQDKLSRAVRWLETMDPSVPALYCSRTILVDAAGKETGLSVLHAKPPCFANALVQNIAGGNTMVFNNAARNLLRESGGDVRVVTHDWWTYIVVTGCDGKVFYDPHPTIRYRQHGRNLLGSNVGWSGRVARAGMLLDNYFKGWNDLNIQALHRIRSRLPLENQRILDEFSNARNQPLLPRLIGIKRSRIYRQTLLGNVGLFAAAVLKRL
jgi:glycosyltransferase involved in cell wall biosynthesis